MASLNYAILAPSTLSPLPLPSEKFLLTTPSISLSLFPSTPGSAPSQSPSSPAVERRALGSVHVSNQRIVFVSSAAEPGSLVTGSASIATGGAGAAGSGGKVVLRTLSVPYGSLLDGRYVQPWFAATYYEALVVPARGGGLQGPHVLRLSFKESGGYQFFELVQEMKDRLAASGGGNAALEPLPLYTPTSPSQNLAELPEEVGPPPLATPVRRQSMPPAEDLETARVARDAEVTEANARTERVGEPTESPPAYDG